MSEQFERQHPRQGGGEFTKRERSDGDVALGEQQVGAAADAGAFVKGTRFLHPDHSDPYWKPQPGQTWTRDAPQAECVVTFVRHLVEDDLIYYTYTNSRTPGKGAFKVRAHELAAAVILS